MDPNGKKKERLEVELEETVEKEQSGNLLYLDVTVHFLMWEHTLLATANNSFLLPSSSTTRLRQQQAPLTLLYHDHVVGIVASSELG